MKTFICGRHGDYTASTTSLTIRGQRAVAELAEDIAKLIGADAKPKVLSSTAKRAKETAAIVAEKFGVEVEEHEALFTDDHNGSKVDESVNLIQRAGEEAEVVICITHAYAVGGIPSELIYRINGVHRSLPNLSYAEAYVVNCESGEIEELRGLLFRRTLDDK